MNHPLIVGLGSIGQRHLRNLKALGVANIAALRTRQRPLDDPELLDGVDICTDLELAISNAPDAAVICNPTALHLAVATALALAG